MAICNIIKELRENKKISMSKIAEALEIPKGTYASYEYGQREPNIEMINRIADFYGVTTDYLLGRPEAKPPADPIDEFVSKSQMKEQEQIILKKWLALNEKQRQVIFDFMTDVVHECESEIKNQSNKPDKTTESELKEETNRKSNISYDEYTAGELEDMMKADENAQKGAG